MQLVFNTDNNRDGCHCNHTRDGIDHASLDVSTIDIWPPITITSLSSTQLNSDEADIHSLPFICVINCNRCVKDDTASRLIKVNACSTR
jgi:hypothetical protein